MAAKHTPALARKDWHIIVEHEGESDEFADAVKQPDNGQSARD